MIRFRLLTLVLFLTVSLSAQRSSLDIAAGADFTYRSLSSRSGDAISTTIISQLNDLERGNLNGHLGVHYNQQLGATTHLRTGLRFSSLGNQLEQSELRWGSQHDGDGGFDPTLPPGEPGNSITLRTDRYFLELPLVVRHELGNGAWTPYLEAGLLPGMYLTTRTRSDLGDNAQIDYRDETDLAANRFHLGASVAVGVSHALTKGSQIFLQPVFRYQITALADGPIRERLFAAGLELGVRRNLR